MSEIQTEVNYDYQVMSATNQIIENAKRFLTSDLDALYKFRQALITEHGVNSMSLDDIVETMYSAYTSPYPSSPRNISFEDYIKKEMDFFDTHEVVGE